MPHVVVLELTAGKNNFEFAQNIETALINKTFIQMMEQLVYDVELTYVKK